MDNSSLRQAEAKLRALGFKITEPEYISGEKDWVYSLSLIHISETPYKYNISDAFSFGDGNELLFTNMVRCV